MYYLIVTPLIAGLHLPLRHGKALRWVAKPSRLIGLASGVCALEAGWAHSSSLSPFFSMPTHPTPPNREHSDSSFTGGSACCYNREGSGRRPRVRSVQHNMPLVSQGNHLPQGESRPVSMCRSLIANENLHTVAPSNQKARYRHFDACGCCNFMGYLDIPTGKGHGADDCGVQGCSC